MIKIIRLTYTYDPNSLPFLDLLITIVGGRFETKTYRKITAANTLLQASSHHPLLLIKRDPNRVVPSNSKELFK